MRLGGIAGAALVLATVPAAAQPIIFSGQVEGHLGYGLNPKLETGQDDSAGFGRFSFSPVLSRATALSQTMLSGNYQREQYFSTYGYTQSLNATLNHVQTLSERLKATLTASYLRSNSLLLNGTLDPALLENFSQGQTTSSVNTSAGLTWQMSARDSLDMSGVYNHTNSHGQGLRTSFDEYSGNLNYLHTLNGRTRIGLRVYANRYVAGESTGIAALINPPVNSNSIGPSIALQQTLSAVWKFDGDVGVIVQHTGGLLASTSTSLGFHGNLCGTYPKSTYCLTAARQSSASAYGGLQRQLSFSATYSYRLSELSSISAQASYANSHNGGFILASDSKILQGSVDYNRELNRRLSAGGEVRGGYEKGHPTGTARSIVGSVYVRVRIGRLS